MRQHREQLGENPLTGPSPRKGRVLDTAEPSSGFGVDIELDTEYLAQLPQAG